jgi:hypothetical protein
MPSPCFASTYPLKEVSIHLRDDAVILTIPHHAAVPKVGVVIELQ